MEEMIIQKSNVAQIKPAEARGKFRAELMEITGRGKDYVLEEKHDGIRELWHLFSNQNVLTSRQISKKTGGYVEKTANFPHLKAPLLFGALAGTILDGELLFGENSMTALTVTGSLPEKAIAYQKEHGWAEFRVFDILKIKGEDIRSKPWAYRREILEGEVFNGETRLGEYITLNPAYKDDKQAILDEIMERGGEGGILKHVFSPYGKASSWVKIKREQSWDVIVTGYKEAQEMTQKVDGTISESKFHKAGLIGAIYFGQFSQGELKEYGACSGMDDEIRTEISQNPSAYIGKVFQMEAQQRLPSGKFRHPRFVQWRPDKDPIECIYSPNEA
jgi:ATP-dependent DNA ligase